MSQNPISKLFNGLVNSDYIDSWSVIHALAGAVIAMICSLFLPWNWSLGVVLGIALIWELFEYIVEGIAIYGDTKVWLKNSVADVVIAVLFGGMVLL